MRWRQFTMRTMLLAIAGAALFCAGYLVGFDNGYQGRFDDLIQLIEGTISPSHWETEGTTPSPGSENSSVITEGSSVDPFAATSDDTDADEPFASTSR
jgi:hypothetical protein